MHKGDAESTWMADVQGQSLGGCSSLQVIEILRKGVGDGEELYAYPPASKMVYLTNLSCRISLATPPLFKSLYFELLMHIISLMYFHKLILNPLSIL